MRAFSLWAAVCLLLAAIGFLVLATGCWTVRELTISLPMIAVGWVGMVVSFACQRHFDRRRRAKRARG